MGGEGEQYLMVMFFFVCFSAACLAIFLVSSISQEQLVHLGWLSGTADGGCEDRLLGAQSWCVTLPLLKNGFCLHLVLRKGSSMIPVLPAFAVGVCCKFWGVQIPGGWTRCHLLTCFGAVVLWFEPCVLAQRICTRAAVESLAVGWARRWASASAVGLPWHPRGAATRSSGWGMSVCLLHPG